MQILCAVYPERSAWAQNDRPSCELPRYLAALEIPKEGPSFPQRSLIINNIPGSFAQFWQPSAVSFLALSHAIQAGADPEVWVCGVPTGQTPASGTTRPYCAFGASQTFKKPRLRQPALNSRVRPLEPAQGRFANRSSLQLVNRQAIRVSF